MAALREYVGLYDRSKQLQHELGQLRETQQCIAKVLINEMQETKADHMGHDQRILRLVKATKTSRTKQSVKQDKVAQILAQYGLINPEVTRKICDVFKPTPTEDYFKIRLHNIKK